MVKVRVSVFGRIGHLVTKAACNADKMDAVAISDTLIGLNYMVYMFQYDSTLSELKGTVKTENGKLNHQYKAHLRLPEVKSCQHQMG